MRRLIAGLSAVLLAGCCSFGLFSPRYSESVDEGFEPLDGVCALTERLASGEDLVARFEFLPVGSTGKWNFEEVRLTGGRLEAYLNGYLAARREKIDLDREGFVGFTGNERYRNIRVRRGAADLPPETAPEGFETYFNGEVGQLKTMWKGVTTEEHFDNPKVRQAATPAKRAEMQAKADLGRDAHWHVRNGSLFFDGLKGGYSLATARDYEDFELWADWRIMSVKGDSGLYLRGSPQVQIWDAHNQWFIGSGGLYNNRKNPSQALSIADRTVGDWNRFHVIMRGERVSVWLNGVAVVEDVPLENYWDRSRPIFFKEQIELQCHGDPIEWRNIFIRPLEPLSALPADRIGVCSWSWRKPLREVAVEMEKAGAKGIHLALGPFIAPDGRHGAAESPETWAYVKEKVTFGDWKVMSTMVGTVGEDYSTLDSIRLTGGIVPDATWEANRRIVTEGARLTKELGCAYMSLHAGFLDENDPAAYAKYVERVMWMRDEAAKYGVTIILESGQETADDLARFMAAVPGIGINFDPANMILYAKGNPREAVRKLFPWIRQVHIKDALLTQTPGTWGTEVPWGDGEVGARAFVAELEQMGYTGNYVIEREGGDARAQEINQAMERLK